jgi:hypothetical protein
MGLETIALLSVAVSAVGAGYGIHSAIEQGEQASDVAKFNAQVQENNALAASQQAQYEADRIVKRNRLLIGKQRAGFGKNGVLGASREDVEFDSYSEAELDRMSALYAGRIAANAQRSGARLSRLEGRSARASAHRRAASILFEGTGDTLSAYGSYSRIRNPDIS